MFVNEQANFTEFGNRDHLFWSQEDLVFGSYTDGPTGDGKYTFQNDIKISEVRIFS